MSSSNIAAASFPAVLEAEAFDPTYASKVFATVWSQSRAVENRFTFAQFSRLVEQGAVSFEAMGARPGLRMALLSKGTLNFYIAILSAQTIGLCPVVLDWRQPVEILANSLKDTACFYLAVSAPFDCDVGPSLVQSSTIRMITISPSGSPVTPSIRYKSASRWLWSPFTKSHSNEVIDTVDCEEAIVLFTTAKSHKPKAILHTHATLLRTAERYRFPAITMKSTLCFIPNFEIRQVFQNFLLPLARGVGVSINGGAATDAVTARMLLAACAQLKPTTLDVTPNILNDWSAMTSKDLVPLMHCPAVRCAGGSVSTAVVRRLFRAGLHSISLEHWVPEIPEPLLATARTASHDEVRILTLSPVGSAMQIHKNEKIGQLYVRGCTSVAAGYLRNGNLQFSATDGQGWLSTNDIVQRTKTDRGENGLLVMKQVNDNILLSTGESFDPAPMEVLLMEHIERQQLPFSRLVVLGQNQASPSLVVEGHAKVTAAEAYYFAEMLWPTVHKVNQKVPLHAQIQRSHLLVLSSSDPCQRLPQSDDGKVLRDSAHRIFSEQLGALALDSAMSPVQDEWDQLCVKARGAGFDNDVEAYLEKSTGKRNILIKGVDSLGAMEITHRKQREIARIADNVKTWMTAAFLMFVWYSVNHGALRVFYDASSGGSYSRVATSVQLFISAATLINTVLATTCCYVLAVFTAGLVDAERDVLMRIALGKKELTYLVLIFFYKIFIYPLEFFNWRHSWKPDNLSLAYPSGIAWFVYALLWCRLLAAALQRIFSPNKLILTVLAFILISNTTSDAVCNYCFVEDRYFDTSTTIGFFVKLIFDDSSFIVLSGNVPANKFPYEKRLWSKSGFMLISRTRRLRLFNAYYTVSLFAYLIGYYKGADIVNFIRARTDSTALWISRFISNARIEVHQEVRRMSNEIIFILLLILVYSTYCLYETLLFTWLGNGTPGFHVPAPDEISLESSADVVWATSRDTGLRRWNPFWARPFYMLGIMTIEYLVAFISLSACVAMPWRCLRCGNAALGTLLFSSLYPTAQYVWVCWIVSKVGTIETTSTFCKVLLSFLQVKILLLWPFIFLYLIGPILTAVTVGVPRIVYLACAICVRPRTACHEAHIELREMPAKLGNWCRRYFDEIRHDITAMSSYCIDRMLFSMHKTREIIGAIRRYIVDAREESSAPLLASSNVAPLEGIVPNDRNYGTSLATDAPDQSSSLV